MELVQEMFNYEENAVRTVILNSEVYFVAKDVCDVLEIRNTTDALKRLDSDEVTRFNLGGLAGEVNLINEPGLYTLVLGSRKPEARQFKRWVTHEVLPSIRKHGAYMTDNVLENAIGNPDFMIGLLENLKEEKQRVKELESKVEADEPKITYYDTILSTTNAVNISQIAEDYGLSPQALNRILKEEKVQRYVGKQWLLLQRHKGKGLTKTETVKYGNNCAAHCTKWTQKGRVFIHAILIERGIMPINDTL
ncbi:phage antirepressor KilAC domain-containing protein [Bacillus sp. ISL-57]|uniref:phage antirepressor KilAC domain-containing protein n=1 Tax=Bacillus sp. ISL-57 TaxID=2819135 RepID=UPI001BE6C547|nr:phage antirepressor [Bacillus sp. ISL-57]MBT2714721.1 phage antirepressor [Bacillus sp. ISL-57]